MRARLASVLQRLHRAFFFLSHRDCDLGYLGYKVEWSFASAKGGGQRSTFDD